MQSIQYLLKLLGLNHRQRRVQVVGCSIGLPSEKMEDSAQMDTWLHKTLLDIQAEHSGNIPRNRWIRGLSGVSRENVVQANIEFRSQQTPVTV